MENVDSKKWEIKGNDLERYFGTDEEIVIPDGVVWINKYAFNEYRRNHYPIKKLTIPGTIPSIPANLFKNMPIEELVLGEGVSSIRESAFQNSGIKKLKLPSTVKYIEDNAFTHCNFMETELILDEGLGKIDQFAFYACSFKKLTVSGTKKFIPSYFLNHASIEELIIKEGVSEIEYSAFCSTGIKKLVLPSTIRSIQGSAFANCNLTTLVLNEGLEEIGPNAFSNNPLTTIIFPKTLSEINFDHSFDLGHRDTELEIVCHFRHIDSHIKCQRKRLKCNLTVLIDDDFNYPVAYDFIQDIKEVNVDMKVNRITFIGYIKKFNLSLLKNAAKKAGIEIEMVEDTNGFVRNELVGSKTKKEEEFDYHSGDLEIDELIDKIKEKSEILEDSVKEGLLEKIEILIQTYQKNLKDLKPTLESESQITLRTYQTPQSLRNQLIVDLQAIDMNFIHLDDNFNLKEKIDQYQKILEDSSIPEAKQQIESMEDKIKQMKYCASVMGNSAIQNEALTILTEIENKLLVPSFDTFTLQFPTNFYTFEQELTDRLDQLYEKVQNAYILYQSLNGVVEDSLGEDIQSLEMIINSLDSKNKMEYQEQLHQIRTKYLEQIQSLQVDSESKLQVREDLMPILENLAKLVPNLMGKRDVLNDIDVAKKIILEENKEVLGAITSSVLDTMSLLENNNLDESLKETVKVSMLQILENSYQNIVEDSFVLEEREDSPIKNLDWNLRATIKILKEIYKIQDFVHRTIQYNETIQGFHYESGKSSAKN